MVLIRSALFTLGLVIWTLATGLVGLPMLLLPRSAVFGLAKFWSAGVIWILRVTVGIRHQVKGTVLPDENTKYIYAIKHQSAWETIAFILIAPPFAGVLKEELKHIPLYGWFMARSGMVPIRRSAKGSALKQMLATARKLIAAGRHLMIMPEGTRVAAGETGVYHPGVYALYKYLKMPGPAGGAQCRPVVGPQQLHQEARHHYHRVSGADPAGVGQEDLYGNAAGPD